MNRSMLIISFVALLLLLLFGCIDETGSTITPPFTASQFFSKVTDLNYTKFLAGEYDGNFVIVDGNKLSIGVIDINSANIDWNQLINFPSGCGVNQAVKIVGNTLVCVDLPIDTNDQTSGYRNSGGVFILDQNLGSKNITDVNSLAVGRSNALYKIHVGGEASPQMIVQGNTSSGSPTIGMTTSNGFGVEGFKFGYQGSTGNTVFESYYTNGDIVFSTKKATASPNQVLTILDDGNVGIGVNAPNVKLDVSGSAELTGSVTATNFMGNNFYNDGNRTGINYRDNNSFFVPGSGLTVRGTPAYVLSGVTVTYVNTSGTITRTTGTKDFNSYIGVGDIVWNASSYATIGAAGTNYDYVVDVNNNTIHTVSNNFQPSGSGLAIGIAPAVFNTLKNDGATNKTGQYSAQGYNGVFVDYFGIPKFWGGIRLLNSDVIAWGANVNGAILADNMTLANVSGSTHFTCTDNGSTRTCRIYPNQVNEPTYLTLGWNAAGATPYTATVSGGGNGGQNNGGGTPLVVAGGNGRGTDNTYSYLDLQTGERLGTTSTTLQTMYSRVKFFTDKAIFNGSQRDYSIFFRGTSLDANLMVMDTNVNKIGIGTALQPSEKLDVNGNIFLNGDNQKLLLGQAKDASIYYDGVDLNINPKAVGTGKVNVNGDLSIDGNIFMKIPYGVFDSTMTQTVAVADTAYAMDFNNTEDSYMVTKYGDTNFGVSVAGDYLIELSVLGEASTPNKHIEIWWQKNGVNVPRSNTRLEFPISGETVIAIPFIIDLNTTDTFRIMYASDSTGTILKYVGATSYSPETPSTIMTIHKIGESMT